MNIYFTTAISLIYLTTPIILISSSPLGWDTITKLHDMLKSDVMFRNSSKYIIIPLHSLMPTASQKQVGVVRGVVIFSIA